MMPENRQLDADESSGETVPQWARDLPDGVFDRMEELLSQGWTIPRIMESLSIPASKRASLYRFADASGLGRRIRGFHALQEALVHGLTTHVPEITAAIAGLAKMVGDAKVSAKARVMGMDTLTRLLATVHRMMEPDLQAASTTKPTDSMTRREQQDELSVRIRDILGITPMLERIEMPPVNGNGPNGGPVKTRCGLPVDGWAERHREHSALPGPSEVSCAPPDAPLDRAQTDHPDRDAHQPSRKEPP